MAHADGNLTRHRLRTTEESAGAVIQIPVEGFGADQALRSLQAKRMYIRQEHEHRGKLSATPRNAEFRTCLMQLMVSVPALAKPITLAREACA